MIMTIMIVICDGSWEKQLDSMISRDISLTGLNSMSSFGGFPLDDDDDDGDDDDDHNDDDNLNGSNSESS